MKKVSVIVTTKNEEKDIERCLHSIRAQAYARVELIVVDNKSTDKTVEIARKYAKKVLTKGPERSVQRNVGVAQSSGDFILIVDADMELEQDVVRECVKMIERGYDALIIPEEYEGDGFWTRCKMLEKRCYRGTGDGEAARFFTLEIFKKGGGYDPALTGPEDVDFHKRLVRCGAKVGRVNAWIIHHEGTLSWWDIMRKRYYYSGNLKLYLEKNKEESKSEFRFIRPAFVKNWRLLARDPVHALGFVVMRFCEGIAVLLSLLRKSKV